TSTSAAIDFKPPPGGKLLHRRHPGANDDLIPGKRGPAIVDVVRAHHPRPAVLAISLQRPALRRRMGNGGVLHPVDEGDVVGVPLAIDLDSLDDMKMVVGRWHLSVASHPGGGRRPKSAANEAKITPGRIIPRDGSNLPA